MIDIKLSIFVYLIDIEKGKINICDITQGRNIKHYTNIEDFYPFLDARRIGALMRKSSVSERAELQLKIKNFMDRIVKIGNHKSVDLSVESVDLSKLQNFLVYIYNCDKKMLDIILNL